MRLKEKFENHYVVFGLSLVMVSFVAGVGAVKFFTEVGLTRNIISIKPNFEKEIEILVSEHNKRKNDLMIEYKKMESESVSTAHFSSYPYGESANRIKELMRQEDEALMSQLDKLQPKISTK